MQWNHQYQVPVVGAIIAFSIAILCLTLGFWKTVFVLVMTLCGAFIGFLFDHSHLLSHLKNFKGRDSI